MDSHQMAWNEKTAKEIIRKLQERRMEGSYAPTALQARGEILSMIPEGASVYRCGSATTTSLGIWEELAKRPGIEIFDPFRPGISPEEGYEIRRRGLLADVMLASSNAVTLDGRLINLDGRGNRVAAMAFGPRKVILAVGMNKVVPDLETGMTLVKHYSAPVNVIRWGFKNPCRETGLCVDCKSPERICHMWSIIGGHMTKDRIHVKLIGENLGS